MIASLPKVGKSLLSRRSRHNSHFQPFKSFFPFTDFMFNEDQDEVQFFYDDTVPLGDAPQDWKLRSVSTFYTWSRCIVVGPIVSYRIYSDARKQP